MLFFSTAKQSKGISSRCPLCPAASLASKYGMRLFRILSMVSCLKQLLYPPAIQNCNGNSPSINVFPFSSHLNGEFPMFPMFDFRKVKPEFFLQIAPKTQSLLLKIVPSDGHHGFFFYFKAPVEVLHWRIGATQCPNASFGHTKDGRV